MRSFPFQEMGKTELSVMRAVGDWLADLADKLSMFVFVWLCCSQTYSMVCRTVRVSIICKHVYLHVCACV